MVVVVVDVVVELVVECIEDFGITSSTVVEEVWLEEATVLAPVDGDDDVGLLVPVLVVGAVVVVVVAARAGTGSSFAFSRSFQAVDTRLVLWCATAAAAAADVDDD